MKKIKVVLFCSAWKKNDPIFKVCKAEYEKMAGMEVSVSEFGGYLEGEKKTRFLKESETADIIITDAWNYSSHGSAESLKKSMADIVQTASYENPQAKIFADLMDGLYEVEVHKISGVTPHVGYYEPNVFKVPFMDIATRKTAEQRIIDGETLQRVLVLDDTFEHQLSAFALTDQYHLTVARNYDEAEKLLTKNDYDFYLGDLLLPASGKNQGPRGEKFVGVKMPVGCTPAFFALSRGVKKVAVVTDANHHDHPASAGFDVFGNSSFSVGDARILMTNRHVNYHDKKTNKALSYEEAQNREKDDIYFAKNWDAVLKELLT